MMNNCIKILILIFLIQGCAAARTYQLNCIDLSSAAGHAYERLFDGEAMVALGYQGSDYHFQAYCIEDGMVRWLKATFAKDYHLGCVAILVIDAPRELDRVETYMTLEDFDELYCN